MDEEHHSTGMVADGGIGVGIKIIQKVDTQAVVLAVATDFLTEMSPSPKRMVLLMDMP